MRAVIVLAGLAACSSTPPSAPPPSSALVTVEPVSRGSFPDRIAIVGTAAPAPAGLRTLSILQPGEVTQLFVGVGTTVRQGQSLVTIGVAPDALSGFQQAQTALQTATGQRATTAQLLTQQLATRDQLAVADKAVADATTVLAALRRAGGGTPVRRLTAPLDGVVTAVGVAPGDRPALGTALVSLARRGTIVVPAGIDPALRGRLHVGQPVTVTRIDGGPPIAARLAPIDGALNPRTRLVDLQIACPPGSVLPGEAVRAAITVGTATGWIVPHRAVVTAGGRPRVFQAVGGIAHSVPVVVRLAGDATDIVDGALDPRRPLIVDGAYQVVDGAAVRRTAR